MLRSAVGLTRPTWAGGEHLGGAWGWDPHFLFSVFLKFFYFWPSESFIQDIFGFLFSRHLLGKSLAFESRLDGCFGYVGWSLVVF